MTEYLGNGLYRIPVPLVGPLKELNVYCIVGKERHLLIDSGFNMPRAEEALRHAVGELGVSFADMDFFVTHMHADHCGLTAGLVEHPDSRIFCTAVDGEHANLTAAGAAYWQKNLQDMLPCGLTQSMLDELLNNHPGIIYAPCSLNYTAVREGDVLHYGEFVLTVRELPGHTLGMACLHDESKHLLFSSDHILGDITPNITRPKGNQNPLGNYLSSLERTATFGIEQALPGHRRAVQNPQARIAELQQHHANRLQEALDVLGRNSLSVIEVAAGMKWALREPRWELFPVAQKHFACCEVHAHLVHLRICGKVNVAEQEGILYFSKV